jgi:hypothetical protein
MPASSSSTCTPQFRPDKLLAHFQAVGDLRAEFDPLVMAVAIRAAIDAVPRRQAHDPDLDVGKYATEIANLFDLATRPEADT